VSPQDGAILITGALGGMGAASARTLGNAHGRLLLTDRDADRLERSAVEFEDIGVKCRTVVGDLSDPSSIADVVDAVRDEGGLRALVHTAAISPTMADWRTVIAVDLVGTMRLLDGLLPLATQGSVAVCFASIAAHMDRPIAPAVTAALDEPLHDDLLDRLAVGSDEAPTSGLAYIWAKTAIVRWCERLAGPWGARGARIVSLSPGLIDTPMGRLELEENPAKRPMMTVTPLRRPRAEGQSELPGRCDEIADTVAFLCSDNASFISGCDIRVDGGFIGAWRYPSVPSRR
jgi:NAD(P)-dependent dehydrogenase (short-subunit alcohol dehydrogenase family)